jgi:5-(carboxyamino)imidazole ribonucleotide mutase
MTVLPVIGVPVKTKAMEGLDSLLSIAQMPPGVPVATVAVNGAKNAGLLAVQILALSNKNLSKKISDYKKSMEKEVTGKAKKLLDKGYESYLKNV